MKWVLLREGGHGSMFPSILVLGPPFHPWPIDWTQWSFSSWVSHGFMAGGTWGWNQECGGCRAMCRAGRRGPGDRRRLCGPTCPDAHGSRKSKVTMNLAAILSEWMWSAGGQPLLFRWVQPCCPYSAAAEMRPPNHSSCYSSSCLTVFGFPMPASHASPRIKSWRGVCDHPYPPICRQLFGLVGCFFKN